MIEMERSKCNGCFTPESNSIFGSCEGCTGIADFQIKCYNILKKIILDNEEGYKLIKMLDQDEIDFLFILLNEKDSKEKLHKLKNILKNGN